jgi:hypothetical protein
MVEGHRPQSHAHLARPRLGLRALAGLQRVRSLVVDQLKGTHVIRVPFLDVPPALDLERRLSELGDLVDAATREELARGISEAAAPFGGMLEYHLGWRDAQLEMLATPTSPGSPAARR